MCIYVHVCTLRSSIEFCGKTLTRKIWFGVCEKPGMSYKSGVAPSVPGHLMPPSPCIPLPLFPASSLQVQWFPLPSCNSLSHHCPGSWPRGPDWSTHENREEGKDSESLWRVCVEVYCGVGKPKWWSQSRRWNCVGLSRCPLL